MTVVPDVAADDQQVSAENEASAQEAPARESVKVPARNVRWFGMHSFVGLAILLPLFVIVATGTVSFFRSEMLAWHIPELRRVEPASVQAVDHMVQTVLQDVPKEVSGINITFPDQWKPVMSVRWFGQDIENTTVHIDPITGLVMDNNVMDSDFADHIYGWHYLRPIQIIGPLNGLFLSGLVAVAWAGLAFTGLYLHRRKLTTQFRTIVSDKQKNGRPLRSWIHTLLATVTMPLHIIYASTGAFFGLTTIALPVVLFMMFGGDRDRLFAEVLGQDPPTQQESVAVDTIPSLDPFLDRTFREIPGAQIESIFLEDPFESTAKLHVHVHSDNDEQGETLYNLHGDTEPTAIVQPGNMPGSLSIITFAFELHFGSIGGLPLKMFFTIGGFMLCVLVVAAARMWALRMATKQPKRVALFERLFDGFGLGVLPAMAIYAWANRLIPWDMDGRGDWEIYIFHGFWIGLGLLFLLTGTGPRRRRALIYSSLILAGCIPFIDGLLHGVWPWVSESWLVPSVGWINVFLVFVLLVLLVSMLGKYLLVTNKPGLPEESC